MEYIDTEWEQHWDHMMAWLNQHVDSRDHLTAINQICRLLREYDEMPSLTYSEMMERGQMLIDRDAKLVAYNSRH